MSVEICNLALVPLGADTIMDLNEDSENARKLKAIYSLVLKDVLRAHPWNFALKRIELAQLVEGPLYGYSHYYQLPPDYLRVVEINGQEEIDYVIEGKTILCSEETVELRYIAYMEDSTLYDSNFVSLLASRLEAELAFAITQSKTLADSKWTIYKMKLARAHSSDAQEGKPQRVERHRWLESRS